MNELIDSLRFVPEEDRELLKSQASLSYDAGERCLRDLSIFSRRTTPGHFDGFNFETIDEEVYYVGVFGATDLATFVDRDGKLLFHSRYYFTHLVSFLKMIDHCLSHISQMNFSSSLNVGLHYVSMEKWFVSYGHFKDEAFSLGHFLATYPGADKYKALLDYPTDERLNTAQFTANNNYKNIERLIFGQNALNAYDYGAQTLKLSNLILIDNHIRSETFHSFPPAISERIRHQVARAAPPLHPRLFLTRSDSYRDISNKSEVESFFKQIGFAVVNPEDSSYDFMVNSVAAAKCIVLFYGSALTNMAYLSHGSKVFVLKSESYMHEDLALWQKVINNYSLDVTVVSAIDNAIRDEQLEGIRSAIS